VNHVCVRYPQTDAEMAADFHGEWNYTITKTNHPKKRLFLAGPKAKES
jgi:hypothetical protein